MGTGVLDVERFNIAPHLRTYAHCSKTKVSSCLWINKGLFCKLNGSNLLMVKHKIKIA